MIVEKIQNFLRRDVTHIMQLQFSKVKLDDSVSKAASENKIEFLIIMSSESFELIIIRKRSLRLIPTLLCLLFKIKAHSLSMALKRD
jgi:hypothetical protein